VLVVELISADWIEHEWWNSARLGRHTQKLGGLLSCKNGVDGVVGRLLSSTLWENLHCVSKEQQLWNGIAQNYKDRLWWHLAEIFKIL